MSNDKEFKPKGEDEIREEVIKEFDLDPENEDDKGRIDKLVAREMNHQNSLGKAIKQKKDYRTKLEEALNGGDGADDNPDKGKEGEQKPTENQPPKPDVDTSNLVNKDELEARLHREKYPNLSDEEYNSINALAKANNTSFEDAIENNPMAKTYFADAETRQRLERNSKAPSTRSNPGNTQTEDEKVAEELSDDLPPGYSLPEKN